MKTREEKRLEELAWITLTGAQNGHDPCGLASYILEESETITNKETLQKIHKILAIALDKFGHKIEARRLYKKRFS